MLRYKLFQDGPFLAFRLILIFHYRIVSYMNIFFTCKNTLVIMLQLYRFYAVQTEKKAKKKKRRSDVSSISIISRGDIYKGTRHSRYLVENSKLKRIKDIEANLSQSEETSEETDKYELSRDHVKNFKK